MLQTIGITVKGKVQGVFYRQATTEKALQLGISGTVQNMQDGSVYIVATGQAQTLNELVSWCRQGPPRAMVTGVHTTPLALQQFAGFKVVR